MNEQHREVPDNYFGSAFFSAFTTLPAGESHEKFIADTKKNIFKKYKDGFAQMQKLSGFPIQPSEDKSYDILYQAVPYCVFGEFDMAIISMIDDFSFATQHFKPNPASKGFKYQVNTGIIPLVDVYKTEPRLHTFRDKEIPAFFNGDIVYPFTGIGSIKLNNAMLVGIGQPFLDLINFFLITWLDEELKVNQGEDQEHKCFYILNENLGWNEIAIYFFGNSMSFIQEKLMMVRQFTLRRMKEHITSLLQNDQYQHDQIKDVILPVFDRLEDKSLLAGFIRKAKKENPATTFEALESHPIIASSMTYGFSPELISTLTTRQDIQEKCFLSDIQYELYEKECERKELISINWKVKPGHEYEAGKLISKCFPGVTEVLTNETQSGKYQFRFPKKPISFKEYLAFANEAALIKGVVKGMHVLKVRSHLSWSLLEFKAIEYDVSKHYNYDLEPFRINEDQIQAIADKLCIYPVPYMFKNQIENLIINYNDAVTDPLMYNYFIGLKAPLLKFLEDRFDKDMYILGQKQAPVPEKEKPLFPGEEFKNWRKATDDNALNFHPLDTRSITEFIQNWNKAYWNRYFHSYYFTEINDFNIEHHGGIQQILFTYDTIYRLLCRRVYGKESKAPFINVHVVPNISSTQFYNTINFTHLFKPAIYACECVHEAANHILSFLVNENTLHEYSFLFNPFAERSGDETEKHHDRDARLRAAVGPRDEYEKTYLNQHFGVNAIRHMITDFCTYVLGYTPQNINDKSELWKNRDDESIRVFYQTHWLLFLVRTDLYDREDSGTGYWFFNETDFRVLFMRLNLMFYLFMDFSREDLVKLNSNCPSVELTAVWENQRYQLIDLVVRLGEALEKEFQLQTGASQNNKSGAHPCVNKFRDLIIEVVLAKGWAHLEKLGEQDAYRQAIEQNMKIIYEFNQLFSEQNKKNNAIKRKSSIADNELDDQGIRIPTNVRFYKTSDREIFIDPKGHLFSISPVSRRKVFSLNITYIKRMWDLSMKTSLNDYKDGIA